MAQTAADIFNEFKDKPNVQFVSLPKTLMSLAANGVEDENKKELLKKMDSIVILSIEDDDQLVKQFEKKVKNLSKKGYEQMVNSNDDGEKAQIEMQSRDEGYEYGKRAEYYAARLVSSVVDVGDDWGEVPQVYQISVLNFKFDKTNKNPVHHYIMCDKTDGAQLSERINVIFMELPKLPEIKSSEEAKNLPTVLKWCKFLKEADNPGSQDLIRAIVESEDGIMKASDTLKNISDDGWRWVIQGQIEGKKRDYTSGLLAAERRGLEQGMLQKATETAKKLLAEGIAPEMIAKCCSLPLEEVLKLKTES
jgi:predicted transposase/invertase (TIGR01784 family)